MNRRAVGSVLLALALVIVAATAMVRVLEQTIAPSSVDAIESTEVSSADLPIATTTLGRAQASAVHRALHDLGRGCERPPGQARGEVLRALRVIKRFAADHPRARFPIDDESGSTIALLFVVRDELLICAPSLVHGVDRLIPPEFRP